MANENDSAVVDIELGGHDHCYHSELHEKTDVFLQKSGTDFECFTNLTILQGVEGCDFEEFK